MTREIYIPLVPIECSRLIRDLKYIATSSGTSVDLESWTQVQFFGINFDTVGGRRIRIKVFSLQKRLSSVFFLALIFDVGSFLRGCSGKNGCKKEDSQNKHSLMIHDGYRL